MLILALFHFYPIWPVTGRVTANDKPLGVSLFGGRISLWMPHDPLPEPITVKITLTKSEKP